MSKKPSTRTRFLQLAYDQMNPTLSTVDGLQVALCNWYCFQYNVPPNDDKLQAMTVEELLVLRMMHQLHAKPELAEELASGADSYEEWLKIEMGADYKSVDDMVAQAEKQEQADVKLAEELPDRITTDFDNARGE